jgi:hypothetical protein
LRIGGLPIGGLSIDGLPIADWIADCRLPIADWRIADW